MLMPISRDCSAPCKPRFCTPATSRPNLSAGIGKTADLLAMMIARALRRPGTQISYTAQTRLDARHRLLDVWWPVIERSKLRRFIDVRRGSGSEAYLFRNGSMLG